MILDCLLREEVLKLFQLCGILRSEIMGLAEILGHVIKFPGVFRERRKRHHQPRYGMARASDPAIVIDAAVSKHLEILSSMCLLCLRIVERVKHRCSVERPLNRSVDSLGERQTRGFEYSGRDIGNMGELRSNFA